MKNVFYFENINSIGGVETFFYYLIKKYENKDITILYQSGDINQLKRIRKYARCIKYTGKKIKCEKAFFNYSTSIIDNIEADEYIQIVHADYKGEGDRPKINPKITRYLGVSQHVCNTFEELTGIKCELAYNPIAIDPPKKMLKLISATRLTNEKGKDRMELLGEILNRYEIPYIWLVFTNDTNAIKNPNIVYMKPKLDITSYMNEADFLVQLSSSEAYCFSVVEMLASCNKPVIVTDLPVYKEIGLDDTNSIRLDLVFDDIPIDKLFKKYDFKYTPKQDRWNEILAKGKNTYKEERKMKVKVECIKEYTSMVGEGDENNLVRVGDVFEVTRERADVLLEEPPLVKILEDETTEPEDEVTEEVVQAVANAIVEEATEQGKEVQEVVEEIVEESKEDKKAKSPKKKK